MADLVDFLVSVRILSGDGPVDNFARSENCLNNDSPIDGTNTIFFVQNTPVAPGGFISFRVDNQLISNPYTDSRVASLNEATGQITLTNPPVTSIFVNYYYYLFPDSVWTQFITSALQNLNFINTSTQTVNAALEQLTDAFVPAIELLCKFYFAGRVAQQTGLWYNQRLQERVDDRDSVSRKWLAIADAAWKNAMLARDDAYRGSGSKEGPSFRIRQMQQFPWTPSR
jgi:hypothetical protein